MDGSIDGRTGLKMKELKPVTTNQKKGVRCVLRRQAFILSGLPGTGKSYLALALAIQDILVEKCPQEKIIIVRSVVPVKRNGIPTRNGKTKGGGIRRTLQAYFPELFGRGDAYDILKSNSLVEFATTSYLRGITLDTRLL